MERPRHSVGVFLCPKAKWEWSLEEGTLQHINRQPYYTLLIDLSISGDPPRKIIEKIFGSYKKCFYLYTINQNTDAMKKFEKRIVLWVILFYLLICASAVIAGLCVPVS